VRSDVWWGFESVRKLGSQWVRELGSDPVDMMEREMVYEITPW